MKPRSLRWRRDLDRLVKIVASISAMVGLIALAWILCVVIMRGAGAMNLDFFTHRTLPAGIPGGGMANAIIGTFLMTSLAALIGVPIGLLAGVFLSEFGKGSKLASVVRFSANILMGTPSILVGMFVYAVIVLRTGDFSGYAGAVALSIIMLPIVVRTTEDMLHLVPDSLRESALALGAPRWRVTLGVVFRAARAGLLTGIILAIARVSGESAPLLFTAMSSDFWVESLSQPTANLTVTIFNFMRTPNDSLQTKAWGASLLITAGVLCMMLVVRFPVLLGWIKARLRRPPSAAQ